MKLSIALAGLAAILIQLVTSPGVQAGSGGGRINCQREVSQQRGVTFHIDDYCYSPTVLEIEAGQSVEWINEDDIQHNVVASGGSWSERSPIYEGGSVAVTFANPGVFPFFCSYHPGMIGVVIVGEPGPVSHASSRGAGGSAGLASAGSAISAWTILALSLGGVAGAGVVGLVRRRR